MCCGKARLAAPNPPRVVGDAPSNPSGASALGHQHDLKGSSFEYVGKTALTVVSPLTGKRYRFPEPGARLEVDVRDRSWITFVPHLKRTM